MHSPADVIRELLINLDLFERPSDCDDWPIYINYMPDGESVPNNVGVIYDTLGVKDGRTMDGQLVQHQGFQLAVRAVKHPEGWAKCSAVEAAFEPVTGTMIVLGSSTYTIQNISQVTPIFFGGLEPGTVRRFLYTLNFLITLRVA